MSREKPILFTGEMVRAILDGRKSQTRRVLRVQPLEILLPQHQTARALARVTRKWNGKRVWFALTERGATIAENRGVAFRCSHGEVGDRLWVRETWGQVQMHELLQHVYRDGPKPDRLETVYRAGKQMGIPVPGTTPIQFQTEWRDDYKPSSTR